MALELTQNAIDASQKTGIQPSIILTIDGIPTIFGAITILKYVRIGDSDLFIGDDWTIGGQNAVEDQETLISMDGTGTKISQQLLQDKGSVSSAASIAVQLIDLNNAFSRIISPGVVVEDILGRNARLYFGFGSTSWPDDYVVLFRGYIDEATSGAGFIKINIVHPEQKKRQDIFIRKDAELSASITSVSTALPVVNADTIFVTPYIGPDALVDPAISYYVRIEDEIIKYEVLTGTQIQTITRGALDTLAAAHAINEKVTSFYVLEEDVMTLALKIMLSGTNGYYREDVEITAFNQITPILNIPNTISFAGVNVEEEYGLVAGDYISTTGATNGANNVTLKTISSITVTNDGSYVTINGVLFTTEIPTAATISFRSQYDTLGQGMSLTPEEVDVSEHERWKQVALNGYEYRIYVRDTLNGKEFLDEQIYAPYGAYSIPRKGKASAGFMIGPIPTVEIKQLDRDNIKNPSNIAISRKTSRYFYNAIAYKFDEDSLEEDRYLTGVISVDEDSRNRIRLGNQVFTVQSKGIRTDLDGVLKTSIASTRRLDRYKFAAEHFEKVEVFFGDGFNLEPGDYVIVDFDRLLVTNSGDGSRNKPSKFYEIVNRSIDLKTGSVEFSLLDTNFAAGQRFGLISPSSKIAVAGTTTHAIIEDSYGAIFPGDEKKKWTRYVGLPVLVHSEDFTFQDEVVFTGFDPGNPYKMLFDSPLSSPTVIGWIVDLPYYSSINDKNVNRLYKLVHAHQSPIVDVVSGASQTVFDVGPGDTPKFFVGSVIVVHNADFTDYSPEVKVTNITGDTITVDNPLGFTPGATHFVEFIGFADEDQAYRYI